MPTASTRGRHRPAPGTLTQPAPVQVHGHEDRGDGEEVHHGVHLQPEPQLVVGGDELRERGAGGVKGRAKRSGGGIDRLDHAHPQAEVQQEEDVEGHVDLQREVFVEVLAGLDGTVRGGERGKMDILLLLKMLC